MAVRTRAVRLSVAAAVLGVAPVAPAAVPTYAVSGMGIPDIGNPIYGSAASSISNGGYVTGFLPDSSTHVSTAFEYHNGTLTTLTSLGGVYGYGNAVNDSGQVAGTSATTPPTSNGTPPTAATVWTNGVPRSLSTPDQVPAYANGINNTGEVTGSFTTAAGPYHAFRSDNGAFADLGTLGGPNSTGNAINAAGVVAGVSDVSGASLDGSGPYVGVYWDAAGAIHAIPTLGGRYGNATSVNADGAITGAAGLTGDNDYNAYLYTAGGTLTDLGSLSATYVDTQGQSVNKLDQVVGEGFSSDGSDERPFLYSAGQMYDLNDLTVTPGWTLQYADGINDGGDIVGQGIDPNGYEHAFLLTPTGVPEPASLSAAVAAGLLGRRRRRGN